MKGMARPPSRRLTSARPRLAQQAEAEQALRESERRLRAIFEAAPIGIARIDLDGRFIESNRAMQELLGYDAEEFVTLSAAALFHPDDRESSLQQLADLLDSSSDAFVAEARFLCKDGTIVWGKTTVSLVRDDAGLPQFCIRMIENITERKQAEDALQQSNKRLTGWVMELEQRTREIGLLSEMGELLQACRSADEAYTVTARMIHRLFPDEGGAIYMINGDQNLVEAAATWGAGPSVQHLFSPDECWALRRGRVHLVEEASVGLGCAHLQQPIAGASLCVPMTAHGDAMGVLHLVRPGAPRFLEARQRLAVAVAEQISLALANLRLHETLRSQSIRDPLTGLFNRRYMEESLEREMRRAARGRHPVGIIMLDLDHFKQFNDTFGHELGDALLEELGLLLQTHIRGEDIACRYGGEEFTLILPEVSLVDAGQRAEHLRQAVKNLHVRYRRQPLSPVTASLGVAVYPEHGHTPQAVLRAADAALYRAKRAGRDRVVLRGQEPLTPEETLAR